MQPHEYFDIEVKAGRDPQSVCDDLNDQDANEDKPYKDACGGKFDPINIKTVPQKVLYQTYNTTSLDDYASSVILRGGFSFPKNYSVIYYFQIANSSNKAVDCRGCLLDPTATGEFALITSGSLQLTADVALTYQPAPGTYFYQLVVVLNCGLETAAAYCANLVPYTIRPRPTKPPTAIPTTAPSGLPTTAPTTLPTTAPSRLPTTSPSRVPSTSPTGLPTGTPTPYPTPGE